jgi:hypothetical protein
MELAIRPFNRLIQYLFGFSNRLNEISKKYYFLLQNGLVIPEKLLEPENKTIGGNECFALFQNTYRSEHLSD